MGRGAAIAPQMLRAWFLVGMATAAILLMGLSQVQSESEASAVDEKGFQVDSLKASRSSVTIVSSILGENVVVAHCRSRDDDLGPMTMTFNQSIHWEFRSNIFLTTHFWCYFNWIDPITSHEYFASFDVWSRELSYRYGLGSTSWAVQEDGFYFFENEENWVRWHIWEAFELEAMSAPEVDEAASDLDSPRMEKTRSAEGGQKENQQTVVAIDTSPSS